MLVKFVGNNGGVVNVVQNVCGVGNRVVVDGGV